MSGAIPCPRHRRGSIHAAALVLPFTGLRRHFGVGFLLGVGDVGERFFGFEGKWDGGGGLMAANGREEGV